MLLKTETLTVRLLNIHLKSYNANWKVKKKMLVTSSYTTDCSHGGSRNLATGGLQPSLSILKRGGGQKKVHLFYFSVFFL